MRGGAGSNVCAATLVLEHHTMLHPRPAELRLGDERHVLAARARVAHVQEDRAAQERDACQRATYNSTDDGA